MKNLFTLVLVSLSISLFAQFGGGGGFGGGHEGGFGGGKSGSGASQFKSLEGSSGIGKITGKVTETDGTTPIEYATIALFDKTSGKGVTGTVSDEKGNFTVEDIPTGTYRVEVSFIGYEKNTIGEVKIDNSSKNLALGKLTLAESANMLDGVVVEAEVTTIETRIDKKVVNVGKDLISAGAMAKDIFNNIPSVEVDMEGNVSLRGSDNVRILVDNRPTNMSPADLMEMLPAEAIEKVELITNPSAKQDPDGMSGIINIITKKDRAYGFNGAVRLGGGTNMGSFSGSSNNTSKFNGNGGLNLNLRQGKLNFFANYNYRTNRSSMGGDSYFANFPSGRTPYYNVATTNKGLMTMQGHNFKIGMDYFIDKKSTLSYAFTMRTNERDNYSEVEDKYYQLDTPRDQVNKDNIMELPRESMDSTIMRVTDGSGSFTSYINSLNFRKDFTSSKYIEADLNYEISKRNDRSLLSNNTVFSSSFPGTRQQDNLTASPSDNQNLNFRFDYYDEKKTNRTELGMTADFAWLNSPYTYSTRDNADSDWAMELSRTNHYKYNEQVLALYGTHARLFGKFTAQLGLRVEQVFSASTAVAMREGKEDNTYDNNYFSLYPSVHLMYKINDNQDILVNYSRRVSRPGSYQLNPTPMYQTSNRVNIGNPYLNPQYTNSVEAAYSLKFPIGSFNASVFYRNSSDIISRFVTNDLPDMSWVPAEDLNPDIVYSTFRNMNKQDNLGIELYAMLRPFKWWNFNLSANGYYTKYTNPSDSESQYNREGFNWTARMMNSFVAGKTGFSAQLSGNYRGPRVGVQGTSKGSGSVNVGLRQELLKKKLSVSLRVSDIFNTFKFNSYTEDLTFARYNDMMFDSRSVYLSLSYRFGKMNYDDKRRSRANSDNFEGEGSSIGSALGGEM